MARVSAEEVRSIVDDDPNISMAGFIRLATGLIDEVDTCDTDNLLSDAMLANLEILVAAHYYTLRDPLYTSKRTEKAAGQWLNRTTYMEEAIRMDRSNCLNSILNGLVKPEFTSLGKPPSDQIDYADRD